MKISIITAVYNRDSTILNCIESVKSQTYKDIEHIFIDGNSLDNTLSIVKKNAHQDSKILSEYDDGIYDAINKGILLSDGEIIGLLHSDDLFFNNNILSDVAKIFEDHEIDAVFGDAQYFKGKPSNVVRYFSSRRFNGKNIDFGWMPAHSTIFFRRCVFEKYGLYKTNYKIAADVEFIARTFVKKKIKYIYLERVLVLMRVGGISTSGLVSTIILNYEFLKALRENSIPTNLLKILSRYPKKLLEFL
ncbi:glycosyltransferase family 2 protein [Polynucleobacter sp. UB-Siik-W21]|uniref:glycosyltransferase family 2 protein n=1 Tax=Polynucleobacter sp. UB-Siik-W21 TaxID=1855646 RepID=UPI001BFE8064|nr:glycosyltransferase family 2 protein [Polynucleobacter sp. UB-Siik-W21]QWD70724.1 glycosyltransferase [Polynucleobacter sp. UB-Siik-W21]